MKKIFIYLVLMLLLQSCSGNIGGSEVPVDNDYRKGSLGVSLGFLEGVPPEEIIENSAFQVGVELKNLGAYNISGGYLDISYDEDYVQIYSPRSQNVFLEGKNVFNKEGEEKILFFTAESLELETQSQSHTIPIIASFCYRYETILEELICVGSKFETRKDKGDPVCEVQDKSYGGQGSPVVISKVEYNVVPVGDTENSQVLFEIEINHKDSVGGLVSNYDSYRSSCQGKLSSDDLNVVNVKAYLSDFKLDCGDESFTFREGKYVLRCSSEEIPSIIMPYEAPLYVKLNYGYVVSESTSIDIFRG